MVLTRRSASMPIAPSSSGTTSEPQKQHQKPSSPSSMPFASSSSGTAEPQKRHQRPSSTSKRAKTQSLELEDDEDRKELLELRLSSREGTREQRKEETSGKIFGYLVLDKAALMAAADDLKRWLHETIIAGNGMIVKQGAHSHLKERGGSTQCPNFIESFLDLFQGVIVDDNLLSSLNAYYVACSFEDEDGIFVTGNKSMLTLIEEESSREEMHNDIHVRTGFPGVRYYMFVNDQGQLERVNLKWDDPTRPSDKRIYDALGERNNFRATKKFPATHKFWMG